MAQTDVTKVPTNKNTSEEGVPEIRVKQDKIILLLLIMMIICMVIEVAAPFFIEAFSSNSGAIVFRFWLIDFDPAPVVYPWFEYTSGIVGFATGIGVLALTGVSFIITLVHKLNKNLFLEKGAVIPFIIAGFFSLLLIAALLSAPMDGDTIFQMPVSCIATGACGVITLVLANVNRVGPWLRAPISWQEATQVKSLEAGIFPILLVLKKLQETKGSIDIMELSRIYGRFKGTIKTKLDRARFTNLIKGQFQGPLNFTMDTINLPFIIDDANVPPSIQSVVDSMLARAGSSTYPSSSRSMAPPQSTVAATSDAPGRAIFCANCGANVQGKEFCSNCGAKVQ